MRMMSLRYQTSLKNPEETDVPMSFLDFERFIYTENGQDTTGHHLPFVWMLHIDTSKKKKLEQPTNPNAVT